MSRPSEFVPLFLEKMDSGDDLVYDDDSCDETSDNDDEEFVDMVVEPEAGSTHDRHEPEEFPYEVLTADKIVQFMVDCIKEVNSVVQVS